MGWLHPWGSPSPSHLGKYHVPTGLWLTACLLEFVHVHSMLLGGAGMVRKQSRLGKHRRDLINMP